MNHITAELDQTDEDILYEVSDETLEAAAGHLHRRPIHEDCWTNGRDGGMRLTWKIKDRRSTKAAITPTIPFSAKRCAYSDMPSFSSQSDICCVAGASEQFRRRPLSSLA